MVITCTLRTCHVTATMRFDVLAPSFYRARTRPYKSRQKTSKCKYTAKGSFHVNKIMFHKGSLPLLCVFFLCLSFINIAQCTNCTFGGVDLSKLDRFVIIVPMFAQSLVKNRWEG